MNTRIAIVDDDAAILDALKLLLTYQQWCVRTFENGDALLAVLERWRPDCVVMDTHISGLCSADLARALTNDYIPIVGLTARPASALAHQVVDAGAGIVLTKPVTEEAIVQHIRRAMGEKSSARH